jgi:hypothetical protein
MFAAAPGTEYRADGVSLAIIPLTQAWVLR